MTEHPLPPPVTRVLNMAQRDEIEWPLLGAIARAARGDIETLAARARVALPLLAGLEPAPKAARALEDARQSLDALLASVQQLAESGASPAPADSAAATGATGEGAPVADAEVLLSEILSRLEEAGGAFSLRMSELQALKDTLPRLYDDPLYNDASVLSLNTLKGKLPADAARLPDLFPGLEPATPPALLRPFLTPLYERTRALSLRVDRFRADYPGEVEILERVDPAVGDLQQAIGGMLVYAEEGRLEDLSNALTLLDRSLGPLAACLQAMRMVEHNHMPFTENPALEAVRRALGDLLAAQGTPEALDNALAVLRGWHASLSRDVLILDETAFMDDATYDEHIPGLVGCLDRMHAALRTLEQPLTPESRAALEQAIVTFRDVGVEFDNIQKALEERLGERPDLSGSRHFQELVGLMRGVYAGTVPDLRLREKLEVMGRLLAAFRARVTQHEAHHPDETASSEGIRGALESQQRAFDHAWAYLEEGDRKQLLKAYGALLPATLFLISAQPREETAPTTPSCPFCGASVSLGSSQCGTCSRVLPLLVAGGLSRGLDLLVGSAPVSTEDDPQDEVAENFTFAASVLDDVAGGILSPDQAREALQPFWDTIHTVEQRVETQVARSVARTHDPDLARTAEEFGALVGALKNTLSEALVAIDSGDVDALPGLRARLLDTGSLVGYVHQEHEAAARPGS